MYIGDALISWKCKKAKRRYPSLIQKQNIESSACFDIVWLHSISI